MAKVLVLVLAAASAARADFSFTVTVKMGSDTNTEKCYMKGHRMMTDMPAAIWIWDLDAQTVTHVDKAARTYKVSPLGGTGRGNSKSPQVDVKDTGQRKTIGGFAANQVILTSDSGSLRGGMRTQSVSEIWYSRDVPGAQEWLAFFKRFDELGLGETASGMSGMIAMLKKSMGLGGVPLLTIVRVTVTGGDAKLAKQLNSALGETTQECSGFSTSPIPDSVFAVPAGFTRIP